MGRFGFGRCGFVQQRVMDEMNDPVPLAPPNRQAPFQGMNPGQLMCAKLGCRTCELLSLPDWVPQGLVDLCQVRLEEAGVKLESERKRRKGNRKRKVVEGVDMCGQEERQWKSSNRAHPPHAHLPSHPSSCLPCPAPPPQPQDCWEDDPLARPAMEDVISSLNLLVVDLMGPDRAMAAFPDMAKLVLALRRAGAAAAAPCSANGSDSSSGGAEAGGRGASGGGSGGGSGVAGGGSGGGGVGLGGGAIVGSLRSQRVRVL